MLQVALNVLLFLPLGFFLRVLGGRGILIAGLAGLVVSGIIETTQLTGVWGIFPCAYRVFDVDDLIANTSGPCWVRSSPSRCPLTIGERRRPRMPSTPAR